jgi:threonine dehydratase
MHKENLIKTSERIKDFIHRTPVMKSELLNNMANAEIWFKCENFQRMGAFKMRGAANAILQLTQEQRDKGVVTHSSGNFAQAVALSAKLLSVKAYIVMPENAPQVKVAAVKDYGGEVILCASTQEAREATADKVAKDYGATFMHPYNDINVVYGQGTAAKELLEDHNDLDYLLAPIGGGGLISGTALSSHYLGNNCITYGAEPYGADDAYQSFTSGVLTPNKEVNTIADGLRTNLGKVTFPIIQEYVKDIIRVEENEIITAMKLIWERMKIIIEPSCAVPFAAVLKRKDLFANKKIGIILSGGNVDLTQLPF